MFFETNKKMIQQIFTLNQALAQKMLPGLSFTLARPEIFIFKPIILIELKLIQIIQTKGHARSD
jgi:hypothetical protein